MDEEGNASNSVTGGPVPSLQSVDWKIPPVPIDESWLKTGVIPPEQTSSPELFIGLMTRPQGVWVCQYPMVDMTNGTLHALTSLPMMTARASDFEAYHNVERQRINDQSKLMDMQEDHHLPAIPDYEDPDELLGYGASSSTSGTAGHALCGARLVFVR